MAVWKKGADGNLTEKEEAYICLHCTKPRCNNCLESRNPKTIKPDWDKIGKMLSKGLTVAEISKQTGVPHQTIHAFIKAHKMHPEGATKLNGEELKELMISGLSTREISEVYCIPKGTVYWWICKYGLNEYQTRKKKVKKN